MCLFILCYVLLPLRLKHPSVSLVVSCHGTPLGAKFFFSSAPSPLCGSKRLNWAATQSGWVRIFKFALFTLPIFPFSFGPIRIYCVTVAILDVSIHFFTFSSLFFLFENPADEGQHSHRQLIPPTMSCIENSFFLASNDQILL